MGMWGDVIGQLVRVLWAPSCQAMWREDRGAVLRRAQLRPVRGVLGSTVGPAVPVPASFLRGLQCSRAERGPVRPSPRGAVPGAKSTAAKCLRRSVGAELRLGARKRPRIRKGQGPFRCGHQLPPQGNVRDLGRRWGMLEGRKFSSRFWRNRNTYIY